MPKKNESLEDARYGHFVVRKFRDVTLAFVAIEDNPQIPEGQKVVAIVDLVVAFVKELAPYGDWPSVEDRKWKDAQLSPIERFQQWLFGRKT